MEAAEIPDELIQEYEAFFQDDTLRGLAFTVVPGEGGYIVAKALDVAVKNDLREEWLDLCKGLINLGFGGFGVLEIKYGNQGEKELVLFKYIPETAEQEDQERLEATIDALATKVDEDLVAFQKVIAFTTLADMPDIDQIVAELRGEEYVEDSALPALDTTVPSADAAFIGETLRDDVTAFIEGDGRVATILTVKKSAADGSLSLVTIRNVTAPDGQKEGFDHINRHGVIEPFGALGILSVSFKQDGEDVVGKVLIKCIPGTLDDTAKAMVRATYNQLGLNDGDFLSIVEYNDLVEVPLFNDFLTNELNATEVQEDNILGEYGVYDI